MPFQIITIYCFFDELLNALGRNNDPQCKLSDAEIMTVALVAAKFFTGNQQASLFFLISHGYIKPLSPSRFNRRLHQIPESLWQFALLVLGTLHQQANRTESTVVMREAIIDTFPVPVCRNIRIQRCRLYRSEAFRGYNASKREYFYGLKVCLIVTTQGEPLEVTLLPGATSDMAALRCLDLNLSGGTVVYGDKGFLNLDFERALSEEADIHLVVPRRKNMKNQLDGCLEYIGRVIRKRIETTISQISECFARSIHAVTARGFELKVFLTVLAFSMLG